MTGKEAFVISFNGYRSQKILRFAQDDEQNKNKRERRGNYCSAKLLIDLHAAPPSFFEANQRHPERSEGSAGYQIFSLSLLAQREICQNGQ
jgi:hypothetical protein